jgi:hypothetical protein
MARNFDGQMLAKMVAMLDSPRDGEAESALHQIRVALRREGKKFYEALEAREYKTAVWENFGHPDCLKDFFERDAGNVAQLRAELEREQELRAEAERLGAEIACKFTAANDALRAELAELHEEGGRRGSENELQEEMGNTWSYWRAIIALTALVLVIMAVFH